MNVLVTAGNTQTPIDRVRCVTNIFTGRTGGRIALAGYDRGHNITLLTSHPSVISELRPEFSPADHLRFHVRPYRTFDDLATMMAELIPGGSYHAIVHAAAVGDYTPAGVYASSKVGSFNTETNTWAEDAMLLDVSAGKVRSSYAELWIRMVPSPKLVDQIRKPWGFRGILVKFKLEVGVAENELAAIARQSRTQSDADLLVANTLETYEASAVICNRDGHISTVDRQALPEQLWERIETLAQSLHS